jgi:hypothetical protein
MPEKEKEKFIKRCVPSVIENDMAEDSDQAIAICYSLWAQGKEGTWNTNTRHLISR